MIFNIEKFPYYEDEQLFNKGKIELEPNSITCFIGCNGSGKTTLCIQIKNDIYEHGKTKEISVDYFGNSLKNIMFGRDTDKYENYILVFDKHTDVTVREEDYYMNAFATSFSSTGEGIMRRLGNHMSVIGSTLRTLKNKRVFIFLDDCDAGTSIDMIDDINNILNAIVYDCIKNNLEYYIILTANSYELCKNYDCISVHDFKHKKFKTYESYKKFVLKSREIKNKRYPEEDN